MHVTTKAKPRTGEVQSKRAAVKAIVVEQHGGPEVLRLKEVEIGEPGPEAHRLLETRQTIGKVLLSTGAVTA